MEKEMLVHLKLKEGKYGVARSLGGEIYHSIRWD